MINRCTNPLTAVTNQISKRTCAIEGGKPTDKSVVYAWECTKHKLIYIGQTGDQLNIRFNRHRSDIICYPDCCELSKHFNSNDCDFEKDLKISILEKVKGSEAKRQYNDQWIIQLDTSFPNGLNVHLSNFGRLYQLLFK